MKAEISKTFSFFDVDKNGVIEAKDLDQLVLKMATDPDADSDYEDCADPAERKLFIEVRISGSGGSRGETGLSAL